MVHSLDAASLFIVAGTFVIAGAVKGVIGLGLPTVSLAILAVALDLHTAMALLLVPAFVTNLWQALAGGNASAIGRRLWFFFVTATVTVWIGAAASTRVDPALLTALLGVLLIVYSAVNLAGFRMAVSSRDQVWVAPVIGAANGVLTGMTGSFVVPGVMFLQAIGLSRDLLIQAMGMLFTVSTLALAAALQRNHLLDVRYGMISAAAVLPAIVGMALGQRIRKSLPEQRFRKVFFASLLILGIYIMVNALATFR